MRRIMAKTQKLAKSNFKRLSVKSVRLIRLSGKKFNIKFQKPQKVQQKNVSGYGRGGVDVVMSVDQVA